MTGMPPYVLITANRNYSSWSLRPWLLMTMLGIPFQDRLEPFTAADNHDAFRAFSPSGTVPCLLHGERTVWDSLGITLYLADRHEGVWPAAEAARAWAQCAVTEMHSGFGALRRICPMNVGIRVALTDRPPALERDLARLRELWAEGLGRFGGPWLAGERFSAVDAFYAPVAYRARSFGLDLGPEGNGWVAHILAQPAMQHWEAAALAETWREASHEAETGAHGVVTADYRH